jgi:broad-specificity NMP kinase
MISKLILIGGEAWTGKSTCAEILYKRLDNSAWLDGDDVWRVNPWSVDDPRLRTSDINMAFVLQTYLQSKFEYVILSSIVLSVPAITDRILQRINGVEYELRSFTLICDEMTLTNRAQQRDNNLTPHFTLLAQTRNLSNTIKIETANRSPEEVVDEMLLVICGTKSTSQSPGPRCTTSPVAHIAFDSL